MTLISDLARKSGATLAIAFDASIACDVKAYNERTKMVDNSSVRLNFEENASTPEVCRCDACLKSTPICFGINFFQDTGGKISNATPAAVAIRSPPGVPHDVMVACKKRETRRFQERGNGLASDGVVGNIKKDRLLYVAGIVTDFLLTCGRAPTGGGASAAGGVGRAA
jgi:hypothetical protein